MLLYKQALTFKNFNVFPAVFQVFAMSDNPGNLENKQKIPGHSGSPVEKSGVLEMPVKGGIYLYRIESFVIKRQPLLSRKAGRIKDSFPVIIIPSGSSDTDIGKHPEPDTKEL